MSPELANILDRINILWRNIEKGLKGVEIKRDCCPITMEQHAGGMRLCFNGVAIDQQNATNRIEAASYLGVFRKIVEEEKKVTVIKAKEAEKLLVQFIDEVINVT